MSDCFSDILFLSDTILSVFEGDFATLQLQQ